MTPLRAAVLVTLAFGSVLATARPLSARQSATATELKAAFVLNFARYTTWAPVDLPAGGQLTICVAGDNRMVDTLDTLARRQQVQDHVVVVRRIRIDASAGCHLIFWPGSDIVERQALLQAVAGRPVLTVSDDSEFTRSGGMINFFVDGGRMRFAVNPTAAARAGLKISSRLLSLAVIVKDVNHGL